MTAPIELPPIFLKEKDTLKTGHISSPVFVTISCSVDRNFSTREKVCETIMIFINIKLDHIVHNPTTL